jgi:hypothetical protein
MIQVTLATETVNEAKRLVADHLGCTTDELNYELLEQTAEAEKVLVWRGADKDQTATLLVPVWSRID